MRYTYGDSAGNVRIFWVRARHTRLGLVQPCDGYSGRKRIALVSTPLLAALEGKTRLLRLIPESRCSGDKE